MTHYEYCPACGTSMEVKRNDGYQRAVCPACGFVHYRNPAPACGVVVLNDNNELLWVRRKFDPRAGLWTLPAGFLEYDEHVEDCAVREAEEETGLEVELTGLLGAYMAMDDPRTQVVLIIYLARRVGGELLPGDDASDARFFPLHGDPPPIAFHAHEQALADIRKLYPAG